MVKRREEGGSITARRHQLPLQHQHLLLLQSKQLSACTLLGDLHVALDGILPNDIRMRIALLTRCQDLEFLKRPIKDRVIGQDDVGASFLDDVLRAGS